MAHNDLMVYYGMEEAELPGQVPVLHIADAAYHARKNTVSSYGERFLVRQTHSEVEWGAENIPYLFHSQLPVLNRILYADSESNLPMISSSGRCWRLSMPSAPATLCHPWNNCANCATWITEGAAPAYVTRTRALL